MSHPPPPPVPDPKPRIAIVEDDRDLLASMIDYLEALAYPVWGVTSAEAFYKRLHIDPADILILDLGLPGEDGLQVAAHVRRLPHLAVIIASARDGLADRRAGLTTGVDRYLVKPVDLGVLVANIEAVRHHRRPAPGAVSHPAAPWRLDDQASLLHTSGGQAIRLTQHELWMLQALAAAGGEVVERQALVDAVFGPDLPNGSDRLDVLVARLRRKVRLHTKRLLPLETAHGIGYALTEAITLP